MTRPPSPSWWSCPRPSWPEFSSKRPEPPGESRAARFSFSVAAGRGWKKVALPSLLTSSPFGGIMPVRERAAPRGVCPARSRGHAAGPGFFTVPFHFIFVVRPSILTHSKTHSLYALPPPTPPPSPGAMCPAVKQKLKQSCSITAEQRRN